MEVISIEVITIEVISIEYIHLHDIVTLPNNSPKLLLYLINIYWLSFI
jgi:hypothetical protein